MASVCERMGSRWCRRGRNASRKTDFKSRVCLLSSSLFFMTVREKVSVLRCRNYASLKIFSQPSREITRSLRSDSKKWKHYVSSYLGSLIEPARDTMFRDLSYFYLSEPCTHESLPDSSPSRKLIRFRTHHLPSQRQISELTACAAPVLYLPLYIISGSPRFRDYHANLFDVAGYRASSPWVGPCARTRIIAAHERTASLSLSSLVYNVVYTRRLSRREIPRRQVGIYMYIPERGPPTLYCTAALHTRAVYSGVYR